MQIRIQHPDGRAEYVTLDDSRTLRCGTHRSADVVLQGAGIFPIHFGILLHRDAFTAVASQRARKIRVNGSRVRKAVLRDGDRIEVGDTLLMVLDTAGPLDGLSDEWIDASEPPADSSDKQGKRPVGPIADLGKPSPLLRLVRSVWFARVLWACAVLPLAALIGIYVGQHPTADELFQTADEAYLPPPPINSGNVDQLEAALTQLEREQNQTAMLDATIEKIEQANHAGDLAAARQRRHELLREYPQLASNAQLWEVLRAAARVQAGQVKVTTDFSSSGVNATPKSAWHAGVVPVPAATDAAGSAAPTVACVYAADAGAVDGLHLATGCVLWRYHVGFECQETLQKIGGQAALLVDTTLQQIVSADTATGQVVWRLTFEFPAAMPAIDQAHAVAVSRAGRIVELVVENGEIVWQLQLPQTLRTATTLDPDAPRCYQVADDSIVYVLSRNPGACLSTHYVGHESGTVCLPPVVVGDYLLVLEQTGPSSTAVHVLRRGDELQAVQTFETSGIVVNQPAVLGELVYLPTDTGRVQILRCDAGDQRKPFARAGEINVVDDARPARGGVYVAIAQNRLWIGNRGVRVFEPASVPDSPKLLQQIWNDLQVTQPLCIQDSVVIAVGHATEQTGLSARAWDIAQGKLLWSTALGVTAVTPPQETQ